MRKRKHKIKITIYYIYTYISRIIHMRQNNVYILNNSLINDESIDRQKN